MKYGMRYRFAASIAAPLVVVSTCIAASTAAIDVKAAAPVAATPAQVAAATSAAHSVRFEPNRGQTSSDARFVVSGAGPAAFLTSTDAVFVLTKPTSPSDSTTPSSTPKEKPHGNGGAVVRMHMRNANPNPQITTEGPLPGTTNYLLGKDRTRWITGVPAYAQVTYHGVYPGIDLVYRAGAAGNLEYDFVAAPGANTDAIDMEYQGADSVAAGVGGGLEVSTAAGNLTWGAPAVYQDVNGSHYAVVGGFTPRPGQRVGFTVGPHDSTRALVIDPVLTYSTFLGGTGGLGNQGNSIVADSAGNAYVTGQANSVVDFPTTTGAFQSNFPGTTTYPTYNAFVTKLSPDGKSLVYSTYLGGSGGGCYYCGDQGLGIAIDPSGNAFVTGETDSPNFPVTSSGFQTSLQGPGNGERNAFLSELNAQGSALLYSTYLGGSGNPYSFSDMGMAVKVDASGEAVVAGNTASPDFPVTSNAFQSSCRSNCPTNRDGVSTSGSTTFTSASAIFNAFDVGNMITGTNIPANTSVASVETPTSLTLSNAAAASGTHLTFTLSSGSRERTTAFLARLNPAASGSASLVYSTLLGGGYGTSVNGMSIDGAGHAYITGNTGSRDFPTTPGVLQRTCTTCDNYSDGSVATDLVTLQSPAATFTQKDVGQPIDGIRLSTNTSIATVVNATTVTLDTPALSAGATGFAIPFRNGGVSFVAKLNPSLGKAALVYSTFFADDGLSLTTGIAVDSSGATYVSGSTTSSTFPTTAGAFERTCHQSTNSPCGTNPTFTDGASTSGSTTFTSASAHFDPTTDPGSAISGTNIPSGTSVSSVVNATMIILSNPATATGTGLTFTLQRNNGGEGFVTKFSAGATALKYSTYLGGVADNSNRGIAVDNAGHAVVVGAARGQAYPVKDAVAGFGAPPAIDATVTELSASGSALVFSTPLGPGQSDIAYGVFVDPTGVIRVTGGTTSPDFPTTPHAFQTAYGGAQGYSAGNAFVAELTPVSSTLPVVTGISASHGPLTGGTAVVITGHGFSSATAVKFGSSTATFTVKSATKIMATSPAQTAPPSGTTLVSGITLTTGAGTSPDNPIDFFTYGVGQWSATGSLSVSRWGASATLLNTGKVLVAGGASTPYGSKFFATAELFDPATGTWSPTGSLSVGRFAHTATLLTNGKVLVAGGYSDSSGGALASAELYDPTAAGCGTGITGCWTAVASMTTARFGHTATLLPSGKVLAAGGYSATSEVYDATANTWTTVGTMSTQRTAATATLLTNGKVLAAGGTIPFGHATPTAELFDPAATGCGTGITGCWTLTGSLGQARMGHTATLLPSGKVLVAGGATPGGSRSFTSIEVYDPVAGTWSLVGLMQNPRAAHQATLLPDGKVLLSGGAFGIFGAQPLDTAELADPGSPAGTAAADEMLVARGAVNSDAPGVAAFTATLLPNGKVLVTGASGDATAELYTE